MMTDAPPPPPDLGTCDCCGKEPAIGVAAVPGIPMSIAWGRNCLNANVIPYGLAVANTAMIGGIDGANTWWRDLVDRTLLYFGKSMDEFNAAVAAEPKIEDPQKEGF